MEVHPPEHPIQSWRDFFVHIATIVVGLLIAIGLEQSVEWFHHRHLVHIAHLNLRVEAEKNGRTLVQDQRALAMVHDALLHDLQTVRTLQKNRAAGGELTVHWAWDDLTDSAYNTARDTGAFTYMPYEEVQDIDSVYTQQQYVKTGVNAYVLSILRIRRPLQGDRTLQDLSPAETNGMLETCADALVNIELLQDLMANLSKDYRRLASE
ncbi:MAG: hypothetical protein ACRYFU_05275 [Janthinobacterium lividum]